MVLGGVDGSLKVEILVLHFGKLELRLHAGASLVGCIVEYHFGDRPLRVDGLPLDREWFALGGPPSPAYM